MLGKVGVCWDQPMRQGGRGGIGEEGQMRRELLEVALLEPERGQWVRGGSREKQGTLSLGLLGVGL